MGPILGHTDAGQWLMSCQKAGIGCQTELGSNPASLGFPPLGEKTQARRKERKYPPAPLQGRTESPQVQVRSGEDPALSPQRVSKTLGPTNLLNPPTGDIHLVAGVLASEVGWREAIKSVLKHSEQQVLGWEEKKKKAILQRCYSLKENFLLHKEN